LVTLLTTKVGRRPASVSLFAGEAGVGAVSIARGSTENSAVENTLAFAPSSAFARQ
jgi:hypothetical protein